MTVLEIGEAGRHSRPTPKTYVPGRNDRKDSTAYRAGQAQPSLGRVERLNERAAQIAHAAALKDAKRALTACLPEEKARLRQDSALLFGLAKTFLAEVAQ